MSASPPGIRRLCICAPSLQLGGLENAASVVANYMAERGYGVRLVLCYRANRFYPLDPSIEVCEPPFAKEGTNKIAYYARWLGFVRGSIREYAPDVVLSYGDFHNALVLSALGGAGVPVVISDRASPGLRFPPHVRLLRWLTYRTAAGIIAQTGRAAEVKRRMTSGGVPVRVIPNPVRPFENSGETRQPRRKVVLAVARHYRVKGLDRLLEAFARCPPNEWILEVAGSEGPETAELHERVERLDLGDRVRFLGSVEDMEAAYLRASLFVLPSRSEGFPNALIEAMVHGCAPISFDIDAGPADIIRDGQNGVLVAHGDIEGLAAAITRLMEDEALRARLGESAMELADELALERIGARVEAFLREAAASGGQGAGVLEGGQ